MSDEFDQLVEAIPFFCPELSQSSNGLWKEALV